MSTYYNVAEITDAYGLLIVAFLIISALLLYRNKLLNVFHTVKERNTVRNFTSGNLSFLRFNNAIKVTIRTFFKKFF